MSSKHVLIVGSQPDVRDVLVEVLAEEGYAVTTFDSGDDAITSATESALPVVLLFGSLVSFAAVSARCQAELPHVTVIVATGHSELPPLQGVLVIKKPFTIDQLLAVFEAAT